MPSCPICQTELPDDFGLIDCPSCEAALFIEMDGTIQSSQASSDAPEFEGTVVDQLMDELDQPEPEPEPEPEPDLEPGPEPEPEPEPEPMFMQEPETDSQPQPQPEMEIPFEDQPLEVSDAVLDQVAEADISQLANVMDEQGAVEGLRYDLEISGIDSADLRHEVYEAFLDKKLGWNTEELMETLKDGVLELKAISAIQAQVIVQRLKTLPLQIRWSQYGDS